MTIRKQRFLANAIHQGLRAALEEHAPDAGDLGTNDVAATAASDVAAAAAAQEPVQGVDAVAQAQIEPVVAAAGGEQSTEGKPGVDAESTVDVPDVDSVAQLQDQVGALEEELHNVEQETLAEVSDQYQEDLEEAVDVVASLEHLADSIDYAIANGHCNPSTNAAFYHTFLEVSKRGQLYSPAALEAGDLVEVAPGEEGTEKGAASIGAKVKSMASAGAKAIIEGLRKFLAWVINTWNVFIDGAKGTMKKLESFESSKLAALKGGEITNANFIARVKLVEGGGDAPAQFSAFVNYCHGNLVRVLAGPVNQINTTILQGLMSQRPGTSATQNLQLVQSGAIDKMISMMYPEPIDNEDLRGNEKIGTDWATGATPNLLGGLRAWIASSHGNNDGKDGVKIITGISRDVPTESPQSLAAADSNTARSDIRSMVSILKQWSNMKSSVTLGRINAAITKLAAHDPTKSIEGRIGVDEGGMYTDGVASSTVLRQYSAILNAFSGSNTLNLVRHMLYMFNLYHAYLEASVAASAGGEQAAA